MTVAGEGKMHADLLTARMEKLVVTIVRALRVWTITITVTVTVSIYGSMW